MNKFLYNLENNLTEFKDTIYQKYFVIDYAKSIIEIIKNDPNLISISAVRFNIEAYQLKKLYYGSITNSFKFPSQITLC